MNKCKYCGKEVEYVTYQNRQYAVESDVVHFEDMPVGEWLYISGGGFVQKHAGQTLVAKGRLGHLNRCSGRRNKVDGL